MLVTKFPDGRVTVECDNANDINSVLAAMRGDGTTAPAAGSNGHSNGASNGATTDANPATTTGTDNWRERLPLIKKPVTFPEVHKVMQQLGVPENEYDQREVRSLLVAKRKAETGK